ncbi:chemotaxis-specific protein-glutamate methyltransferase CheB [Marinibaculum pumilum]|uniref:Protein-glutamate methylesterase/protein-glutamine glutaminase n=1 Tax=Marinibaculum pumilum TaxID=1766165 RepID=A0ABV7KTY8_9PROT
MKTVLVVDDSALMRRLLVRILTEGGFRTIVARNGADALEMMRSHRPDVVTLDINMPEMDGLTCLARLMEECPVPVVMCSSLTEQGAIATFEALELGAVDFIHKPDGTVSHSIYRVEDEILQKVRAASRARLRRATGLRQRLATARQSAAERKVPAATSLQCLVVIGVSTGGPATLEDVLVPLPADFPGAIVIAQHMPAGFTATLAERLDRICSLTVAEVTGMTEIRPGQVYLGRGNADVVVARRGQALTVTSAPIDAGLLWHPSVTRLVTSAMAHVAPERLIGVQLTGMGDDGATEMVELKRRGGRTIAEAEETAVVFGMPKEVIARGGATAILPSRRIGRELSRWATAQSGRMAI